MARKWTSLALPFLFASSVAAADPPQRPPDWTRLVFHADVAPVLRGFSSEPAGGAALYGDYSGSIVIGGNTYQIGQPGNDPDIFLAAIDGEAQVRWAKVFGKDGSEERSVAMTTDAYGDIYLIASIEDRSGLDVGCGLTPGPALVAKLDSDGHCRWSRAIDIRKTAAAPSIGVGRMVADPAGGLIVGGFGAGDATWPNGKTTVAGHGFIVRLDENGSFDWLVDIVPQSPASFSGPDVGVDGLAHVYAALSFAGSVSFSGQTFTTPPSSFSEGILARFKLNGALETTKVLGGPLTVIGNLAVAPDGAVALLAEFRESAQIDSVTVSDELDSDISMGSFFRVLHPGDLWFVAARLASANGAVLTLDPFPTGDPASTALWMALPHNDRMLFIGPNGAFTSPDWVVTRLQL